MHKFVAALVAAFFAVGLTPPASSSVEPPTRVLIVGDSVTQGFAGDYTWRYFLWRSLQAESRPVDFVGRRTGSFRFEADGSWSWNYNGEAAYADPAFDQDHGATWGGRMSSEANWFHEPVGPEVRDHRPDIVVSLWGINDLGHADTGPADLIETYRGWIAEVRAGKADTDIVIGRLPYTWLYDGEPPEFNDQIDDLAAELSTVESRIVVATMSEPYTQADDSSDSVHPTTSGQQKIARMMHAALAELLPPTPTPTPTPSPVPVPAPSPPTAAPPAAVPVSEMTPPAQPRRVRAQLDGRRTTVRWRKGEAAAGYIVTCGTRSKVTSATTVTMRARSSRCNVRSFNAVGSSAWVTVRVRA